MIQTKNLRALEYHRMSGNSKGNKLPTDELAMRAILKDMGVTEYEPRVVQQMLEFSYRYTTEVLEEAKLYSNHARKKQIDLDDVKLAVTNRGDRTGRMPPRIDLLQEMTKSKNSAPLPAIKSFSGPRIPPDRYCLTGVTFKVKDTVDEITKRNSSFEDVTNGDVMDVDRMNFH